MFFTPIHYLSGKGFNYFITYEVFDWSLEKRIKDFSLKNNIKLEIRKNDMFITCPDISEEILNQKKIYGMQKFYKIQRQSLNIKDRNLAELMDFHLQIIFLI